MQCAWWRRVARAGISGVCGVSRPRSSPSRPRLLAVTCGFPKESLRGRRAPGQFGDDAWFSCSFNTADVIGVADGVGGWRAYGIDPGEFSSYLMRTCQRLVEMGHFNPAKPAGLLARSYYELLEHKKPILGSSTACVMILNRDTSVMYTANIGDSGYMVVRKGRIIHRSQEQQHYFNTPFQLSLPPPGHGANVLSDRPEAADTAEFAVEDGDVILVATDGVFDNVPESELISELKKAQGISDPEALQAIANSIAWMARSLSFDGEFMSPFAENARNNGIDAIGGKPDDITVLLATVAL
ncbi:protein phosphatase PTC7 homolog [Arctopsyche grandis]|uniref:protein phosphatase PTC7 homolog n=1 Tax=Arctopsyche grandis TaxID=121162 RepID=UPI00406D7C45